MTQINFTGTSRWLRNWGKFITNVVADRALPLVIRPRRQESLPARPDSPQSG